MTDVLAGESVSALWGAGRSGRSAREIAEATTAAVRDVRRLARTEEDGLHPIRAQRHAQWNARGLIAVAFTHRDSRAGDPDLPTHLAISNKVQALRGRWLALDGPPFAPCRGGRVGAVQHPGWRRWLTAHLGLRFVERQARTASDGA